MDSLVEHEEVPKIDKKRKSSKKKEARKKLKLVIPKREEGKLLQSTLDSWLFKKPRSRLHFKERVLLKEITPDSVSWTTVPLKGFLEPWSAFSIKRQECRSEMKSNHQRRRLRLTPKNMRKTRHILETMLRENTLLGYLLISFLKIIDSKLPTIQGGCMSRIGLEKFEKDNVIGEVSPEVDDKGEFTEVQVLQEFDPDQFLAQLKTRSHLPALFGTNEIWECANSRW